MGRPVSVQKKLAHRIRELRDKVGKSQEELAKDIESSPSLVRRIEGGTDEECNPTLYTLIKLAEALNVEVADLFK